MVNFAAVLLYIHAMCSLERLVYLLTFFYLTGVPFRKNVGINETSIHKNTKTKTFTYQPDM